MKILIVDEDTLFREGLASLIRAHSFFQQVGEANSVESALNESSHLCPDVILVPCDLSDGSGVDIVEGIRKQNPGARFFFLADCDDKGHFLAAIRAGAKGFLMKKISSRELMNALQKVAIGEAVIDGKMLNLLLDDYVLHEKLDQPVYSALNKLTARELEVLYQLTMGATNQEIARRLSVSENTVKNHVHNILNKLNLANRHAAINLMRTPLSSNSAAQQG